MVALPAGSCLSHLCFTWRTELVGRGWPGRGHADPCRLQSWDPAPGRGVCSRRAPGVGAWCGFGAPGHPALPRAPWDELGRCSGTAGVGSHGHCPGWGSTQGILWDPGDMARQGTLWDVDGTSTWECRWDAGGTSTQGPRWDAGGTSTHRPRQDAGDTSPRHATCPGHSSPIPAVPGRIRPLSAPPECPIPGKLLREAPIPSGPGPNPKCAKSDPSSRGKPPAAPGRSPPGPVGWIPPPSILTRLPFSCQPRSERDQPLPAPPARCTPQTAPRARCGSRVPGQPGTWAQPPCRGGGARCGPEGLCYFPSPARVPK